MRLSDFFKKQTAEEQKAMPSLGLFQGEFVSPPPAVRTDPLNLISLNIGFVASLSSFNARNMASAKPQLFAKRKGKKLLSGVKMREVSQAECKTLGKHEEQGNIVEILEHPVLDLLDNGSEHLDGHALSETTELYLSTVGTCYWVIEGKNEPKAIDVLPAEYTTPWLDNSGHVVEYVVKTGSYERHYDKSEIIVMKNVAVGGYLRTDKSPIVGLYGQSPIEQAIEECELMRSISKLARSVANDPRPSMMFSLKEGIGDLDEGQIRLLNRQFSQLMSGRNGKFTFMPAAIDSKPLTLPAKDMEWEDGRRWLMLVIANAFGIGLDLINPEKSNRATSGTSYRSYAQMTLVPKLKRKADTLTKHLLPRYDEDLFLVYTDPTPIDEEQSLKEEDHEVRTGIISINEARAKRGLPPLSVDMRGSPSNKVEANVSEEPKVTGEEL